MDTVNTSLLQAVSTLLLTEARGIAGQSLRQLILGNDRINKLTDHGMLAGTDQIQVLALDLVHHRIHLGKTHNAGNNLAADHERRYTVGKSSVDHEIAGIGNNCGVQSRNITHQIIETVSGNLSGSIQIDTVELLHDLSVIGNLKIRNNRLTVTGNLHVLGIILTDRNRRIDDIRNGHHQLQNTLGQLLLLLRKLLQSLSISSNFLLHCLSLLALALSHQLTDLLGQLIAGSLQIVSSLLSLTTLCIQLDHLVYHGQLVVLEFLLNILFNNIRILTDKLNI